MFDATKCALLVPVPGGQHTLNLEKVYDAEARLREVATTNAQKGPELMWVFNEAFLGLTDHLCTLTTCRTLMETVARKRRSVVILDLVPQILEAKGLASSRNPGGSENLRQAVLDGDQEYGLALDAIAQIECMQELLEGKKRAFEKAHSDVRAIVRDNALSSPMPRGNQHLSAGAPLPDGVTAGQSYAPAAPEATGPGRRHPGFGEALT